MSAAFSLLFYLPLEQPANQLAVDPCTAVSTLGYQVSEVASSCFVEELSENVGRAAKFEGMSMPSKCDTPLEAPPSRDIYSKDTLCARAN